MAYSTLRVCHGSIVHIVEYVMVLLYNYRVEYAMVLLYRVEYVMVLLYNYRVEYVMVPWFYCIYIVEYAMVLLYDELQPQL